MKHHESTCNHFIWRIVGRLCTIGAFVLGASAFVSQADAQPDLLTIGGSVTEIVYELGQEHRLVGRDATSTFPAEAERLPNIGYMRALSPEGVLSVNPKLIISEEGAGPRETIEQLEAASIPFIIVPDVYTAEGVVRKIKAVGVALGVENDAEDLANKVATELTAVTVRANAAAQNGERKRVLFILSTQSGRILASGRETAADGVIKMAGGINAISDFAGYKQMSDEAVTAAAPDVILMMDRGGDHSIADDELFSMPAIITTPAARDRAIVRMDGLTLLGFGPRTAIAVKELSEALYGDG